MTGDALSEGLVALDNSQTYVQACAARGYQHGDLTVHSRQLYDWYGTEDGLDLTVLDADLAVLGAVARSCSDARESLRAGAVALDGAWSGHSGGAALEFVARHGTAAATVVDAVESACRAVQRLRDELGRVIDAKVRATLSADDRAAAQRSAWLSAARAVLAGDTEDAAVVVDSEIRPHVEAVIAGEWLSVMRHGLSAATEAYRAAADALSSHPTVRFEIPGGFGPRSAMRAVPAVPAAAAGPAGAPSAPTLPTTPSAPTLPAAAVPSPAVAPVGPADPLAATPAALPAAPMSLPDPMSAMGGLPGQVADGLGGLLGGGSGMSDPPSLPELDHEPDDDEPVDAAEPEENKDDSDEEEESAELDEPDEPDETVEPDATDEPEEPSEASAPPVAADPAPTPVPEPVPLAEPVPEPVPAAEPETPCEIAADELPQVGE